MKKCPECGNPSYDGAPVCGNCGYTFPKPKMAASKREDIFQDDDKTKKSSNNESTSSILKNHKLLIGAIILITIIAICGIVLTGSNNQNNSSPLSTDNQVGFDAGAFSFKYPKTWNELNVTDSEREDAKFFETEDGTVIEFYNVTSDYSSLKELTQSRISYAQENGAYVELIETTDFNGVSSSNVILENPDGNYTRFVSILDDGVLNVFKITGSSKEAVTSESIETMLNSITIA